MKVLPLIGGAATVAAQSATESSANTQRIIVEWNNDVLIESIQSLRGISAASSEYDVAEYVTSLPSRRAKTLKSASVESTVKSIPDAIQKYFGGRLIDEIPTLPLGVSSAPGVKSIKRLNALGIDIIEVDANVDASALLSDLQNSPAAIRASLSTVATMPTPKPAAISSSLDASAPPGDDGTFKPNDPYYLDGKMWHMDAIGMNEYWATHDPTTPKPKSKILAVIDTGLLPSQEDLRNQLWTNPGEIPNNGIDDDGNGYVDDYYGYSFALKSGTNLMSGLHGAHVSGTALAQANNGKGVIGVASLGTDHKIMTLNFNRAYTPQGEPEPGENMSFALEALNYAAGMGADVTNNSWGILIGEAPDNEPFVDTVVDAYKNTESKMVHVFAAGNHGADLELKPSQPQANLGPVSASNTIVVGGAAKAEDGSSQVWAHSAFNPKYVSACAPAAGVMSTFYDDKYMTSDGTSMASPHVAGVVLLMLDHAEKFAAEFGISTDTPALTGADIKSILSSPASVMPATATDAFKGVCAAGGVVSVPRVLNLTRLLIMSKADDSVPGLNAWGVIWRLAVIVAALVVAAGIVNKVVSRKRANDAKKAQAAAPFLDE